MEEENPGHENRKRPFFKGEWGWSRAERKKERHGECQRKRANKRTKESVEKGGRDAEKTETRG